MFFSFNDTKEFYKTIKDIVKGRINVKSITDDYESVLKLAHSIFILEYISDNNFRRRIQRGLNKAIDHLKCNGGFDKSLLNNISPLGWKHLNFLDEYKFNMVTSNKYSVLLDVTIFLHVYRHFLFHYYLYPSLQKYDNV